MLRLQGSNFGSEEGIMLVRGHTCAVETWAHATITCSADFDAAAAGDLVGVARAGSGDTAAWWDIANDVPVAVEGAGWCPEPCPVDPVVTTASCDMWPWGMSAETCFVRSSYRSTIAEVRARKLFR